jgi:hypothetical protein
VEATENTNRKREGEFDGKYSRSVGSGKRNRLWTNERAYSGGILCKDANIYLILKIYIAIYSYYISS